MNLHSGIILHFTLKLPTKKYSEEYIELLKTVLSFPEIKFSGENTGKSKDFENLEKEFQRLEKRAEIKKY